MNRAPQRELPAVAHVLGTWLRGTENWIYDQVRFTRRWRPVVIAKHLENAGRFPWPSVHALAHLAAPAMVGNRLAKWRTGVYPLFRRAARREGVALLHAHFGHLGGVARGLARELEIPFVVSFYGVDMWQHRDGVRGLRAAYRADFEAGAGFIAEGPAAAERLVEIGCPPAKVFVHRLGIDPAEVAFAERRPEPGEPLRVLMAARFVEKKGLPYGVEAFCRAAAREPRLRLTIVGGARGKKGGEARIAAELYAIVARHRMEARVRFTGFLPLAELAELTRTHHLLMHPSVHAAGGDAEGGHPVVLTQAAATGMPLLATRHCDIPEIVVHGQTGWLVPERDAGALADALLDFAARPEALPEYGRRARALVEAKYDARRDTLDEVYRSVLEGRHGELAAVAS
jgi:colanic acid/amylovoran biosynthesis glycosyltransferase